MIGSDEGIKLGLSDGKLFVTILRNIYGIILGLDVGRELRSLDESFDGSNDGKLEGILIGGSLVSTDIKVLGSDEGIKLGLSYHIVFVTILGNVDGIILGIDAGTELGYLDGPFDGSNDEKLEVLLIGG